jgi:hypothetical protein
MGCRAGHSNKRPLWAEIGLAREGWSAFDLRWCDVGPGIVTLLPRSSLGLHLAGLT